MLSGNKIKKQVTVQVSTHQDALIISQPMSSNLSRSYCTFTPIIENPKSFDQSHLPILQQLLRIHSKSAVCMVATSKVKGHNAMSGLCYEQQIPLLMVMNKFMGQSSSSIQMVQLFCMLSTF
eukprot:8993358-Ditylum_brightwellii.AAC.1